MELHAGPIGTGALRGGRVLGASGGAVAKIVGGLAPPLGVIYTIPGLLALSVGTDRWTPTSDGRITRIDTVFGQAPRGSSPPLVTDTTGTFLALLRNGISLRRLGVFNGGRFAVDYGEISFQAGDTFTIDIIQVGTGFPGADATFSFVT